MEYKAYPNKEKAPSRMSRKRERATVFLFNKKMAKKARKAARLARKVSDDE